MYKNEKATQFHSTITLIQGCLIKNTSWGDEDVIVEERSRNYRSEWIGLQERKEKRMETNWAISGNTPMHLEWGNKGSFESRLLGTYLNKPKWKKKSIIVEVHNYFNKNRIWQNFQEENVSNYLTTQKTEREWWRALSVQKSILGHQRGWELRKPMRQSDDKLHKYCFS